jgi:hypothetical protein
MVTHPQSLLKRLYLQPTHMEDFFLAGILPGCCLFIGSIVQGPLLCKTYFAQLSVFAKNAQPN